MAKKKDEAEEPKKFVGIGGTESIESPAEPTPADAKEEK